AHANQFIHLSEGGDHEEGRDHYWGREATGRHGWKRTRIVSIEIETDNGPLVIQITPFAAYDLKAYPAQPSRLVVEWPDARELREWVPAGENRILRWIYRTLFLCVDKMSEINRTANLPALTPPSTWCLDLNWPRAMIAFGLGLTAVWTCLLACGFVRLIGIAF